MTDTRPLWHQVADIRTDDEFEAHLRAMLARVETEGGCSELMTTVVMALGDARNKLKTARLTLLSSSLRDLPDFTDEELQARCKRLDTWFDRAPFTHKSWTQGTRELCERAFEDGKRARAALPEPTADAGRGRSPHYSEWRPIATAPKDNRERLHYIIITNGILPDVAIWYPEKPAYVDAGGTQHLARPEGWFNVSRSRIHEPTHWMPLPAPPSFLSPEKP